MMNAISNYISRIEMDLHQGNATEHTHRPTLRDLIEDIFSNVLVTNEPKHIECGAPDLVVSQKSNRSSFTLGYIEAKDVGTPLDIVEKSDQLQRYLSSIENFILTDYLEFRWYVNGELRQVARLANFDRDFRVRKDADGTERFRSILEGFVFYKPQEVTEPEDLARRMARITHLVRDIIVEAFRTGQASPLLVGWRDTFARVLISDLGLPEKLGDFADMFAQTLAYGLFSARIMGGNDPFTRHEAQRLIPKTNPFLREFFYHITGPQMDEEPYATFLDDLVSLLNHTDIPKVMQDFGKRTRQEDPTVHFYETFLAAYDPKLREKRGVYYTPDPVVSYLVRSVDHLLKTQFSLVDGLADTTKVKITRKVGKANKENDQHGNQTADEIHRVLVLDPATGTGTFLYAIVNLIRQQFVEQGNAGMWSSYVRSHLLPRLFGFEYLMAPYAVAHFKLALQLAGYDLPGNERDIWVYDFQSSERINVFLTNTLEGPHEGNDLPLFTKFIAAETQAANRIKQDLPIMVVIGNPPYAGQSSNNGDWIIGLLKGRLPDGKTVSSYYQVDGAPLTERNTKWLRNDYVKFIRFGQWRIDQTGTGIMAYITSRTYLDNPTFRGMRQSLMTSFDEIYILDLHGYYTQPNTPAGTPDQNVFDITEGVSIGVFIKKTQKSDLAKVYHYDVWGTRKEKYKYLDTTNIATTEWQQIHPCSPFYFFSPRTLDLQAEYLDAWSLVDIFPVNSLGIATARDKLTVKIEPNDVYFTVKQFVSLPVEKARDLFDLGKDAQDWKVNLAQEDVLESGLDPKKIVPISYRPFDTRYTYYTGKTRGFMCRPRPEVMHHMVGQENKALCFVRRSREGITTNFLAVRNLVDKTILTSKDNANVAPLYLIQEDRPETNLTLFPTDEWSVDKHNRIPNISKKFISEIEKRLGITFVHPDNEGLSDCFGPEDIFNYVYAICFSEGYRDRYQEFINDDFPRIPITSNLFLFRTLCRLGKRLVDFHLLNKIPGQDLVTRFSVPGTNKVEKRYPKYDEKENRVYINKSQFFDGISTDVWNFFIGNYRVVEKWLSERSGRSLSYDDLVHIQKVVVAIEETINLMEKIDEAIGEWPIE